MTTKHDPNLAARMDCPACQASATERFKLDEYVVADCTSCGHRFVANATKPNHVATVYGDGYFFDGKDGYDDYLADGELLRAQGRRYGQLLKNHAPPGTLLDVGAAAGFIQAGLEDTGWSTTGLEPNPSMSAYARDSLGLNNIPGTLEDLPELPQFDVVCMIQVVGHFHDLSRALDKARALTRVGGLLLVEYWRRDAPIARLFGKHWHEYSPPSVLHFFTRASLDTLMATRDFKYIASGAPRKYISGRHAKSLLSHKFSQLPFGRPLARLAQVIPNGTRIRYPAFDLEWRLYERLESA